MESSPPRPLDRLDYSLVLALLAVAVVHLLATFQLSAPPFEDAAILMRYAENLSLGHGIVWNIGEPPVDGATDFLFYVAVAACGALGMSIENAARLLPLISHFFTIVLLYAGIRRLHGAPRWMALLSGAYLILGPGTRYIEAYFGTNFFALFALTSWMLAYQMLRGWGTPRTSVWFALSSLALGLTRPEGVLVSAMMLALLVWARGWRATSRTVVLYVVIFGGAGAAYFLWRWNYFGYPLPNPFYVKGGGAIYLSSLVESLHHVTRMCLPFLPIVGYAGLLAVSGVARQREIGFVLVMVLGYTVMWILISGRMNYLMRFQYAIVPIVLLSWPALLLRLREAAHLPPSNLWAVPRRRMASLLVVLFVVGALGYQATEYRGVHHHRDGTDDVGRLLAQYDTNYTIAVTNAGLLPFLSKWKALDVWGLNDQWLAHHHVLTDEYLDRYRPVVIQFDGFFSPLIPADQQPESMQEQFWFRATTTLQTYAEKNDYVLAAAYGISPYKCHYYYVRSDVPESAEIVRGIRETDYRWVDAYRASGKKCLNFADL